MYGEFASLAYTVINAVLGLAIAVCVPLPQEFAVLRIDISLEVAMRTKGVWAFVAERALVGRANIRGGGRSVLVGRR